MKYLSQTPTSLVQVIDEDVTRFKSLQLGFTVIDDLITHSRWEWRKDYTERSEEEKKRRRAKGNKHATKQDLRIVNYTNNADRIGAFSATFEIYIYNFESLVKKTAVFWGYRMSNIWRTITVDTFLKQLKTELFDFVNFSFQVIGEHRLVGMITSLENDTEAPIITVSAELGSLAGSYCVNEYPENHASYWLGDPSYRTYNEYTKEWELDRVDPSDVAPTRNFDDFELTIPITILPFPHKALKQPIELLIEKAPKTQITTMWHNGKVGRLNGQ